MVLTAWREQCVEWDAVRLLGPLAKEENGRNGRCQGDPESMLLVRSTTSWSGELRGVKHCGATGGWSWRIQRRMGTKGDKDPLVPILVRPERAPA
jgi:hypothetical protein